MGLFNQSVLNNSELNQTPVSGSSSGSQATLINPTVVNSTTYVDLLGLLVGLERITGEPSDVFLDRLYEAVRSSRTGEYAGILNNIRLNLGLPIQQAISISCSDTFFSLNATPAGLTIIPTQGATSQIPLVGIDQDGLWAWRRLSDVVADINSNPKLSSNLLIPDAPALQICSQTNISLAVKEKISGKSVKLQNFSIIPGSELFSSNVPHYVISSDRTTLFFDTDVPQGTSVSYQSQTCPYNLVVSPVALMSLVDPNFQKIAVTPNNTIVYQVLEFVQEIARRDQSYWAK